MFVQSISRRHGVCQRMFATVDNVVVKPYTLHCNGKDTRIPGHENGSYRRYGSDRVMLSLLPPTIKERRRCQQQKAIAAWINTACHTRIHKRIVHERTGGRGQREEQRHSRTWGGGGWVERATLLPLLLSLLLLECHDVHYPPPFSLLFHYHDAIIITPSVSLSPVRPLRPLLRVHDPRDIMLLLLTLLRYIIIIARYYSLFHYFRY